MLAVFCTRNVCSFIAILLFVAQQTQAALPTCYNCNNNGECWNTALAASGKMTLTSAPSSSYVKFSFVVVSPTTDKYTVRLRNSYGSTLSTSGGNNYLLSTTSGQCLTGVWSPNTSNAYLEITCDNYYWDCDVNYKVEVTYSTATTTTATTTSTTTTRPYTSTYNSYSTYYTSSSTSSYTATTASSSNRGLATSAPSQSSSLTCYVGPVGPDRVILTDTFNAYNARCVKYDFKCTHTGFLAGISECSEDEVQQGTIRTLYTGTDGNLCAAMAANTTAFPNVYCCDYNNCNAPPATTPVGAIAGGIGGALVLIIVGTFVGYRKYKAKLSNAA